ncbi:MAG: VWA domain-containing protein [Candidatus Marinimicrobia bacterium]|nr:VWA domain-containing protein [Candidatus Neomarinimicrobiota bacterium]MBL7022913.1 VWA domain-containing protein [Candidatus Neomarinimicrobiota bacterium]MBL7109232.1 VWA domain-containing protein [Candidatus Neomarinimicrobiota bacterium]
MIEFANPYFLLLLLTIPVFVVWYLKKGNQEEATVRYSSIELIPREMLRAGKIKINILLGIKFLILILIIFALARPRLSDTIRETKTDIIDILLVIDQSSSMLAQDFKPDRLGAAKEVAKSFIKDREGDRLGIIVFAGISFIQCPLTTDTDVLIDFADQIQIANKEHDGTAIGMAIANGINRLRDSESKSKVMILLSDGSNNRGELDPLTAADLAAKLDVKIYTVGAGTKGVAPYPVTNMWGKTVLQNVKVEVDEETLSEIAEITGGKFFRATDNKSLQNIYKEINQLERTEIEIKEYQNYTDLYNWLTIPALFLAVGFVFISRGLFRKSL